MNCSPFLCLYGLMNIVFSAGKDVCSLFYLYWDCFVVIFLKALKLYLMHVFRYVCYGDIKGVFCFVLPLKSPLVQQKQTRVFKCLVKLTLHSGFTSLFICKTYMVNRKKTSKNDENIAFFLTCREHFKRYTQMNRDSISVVFYLQAFTALPRVEFRCYLQCQQSVGVKKTSHVQHRAKHIQHS